MNGLRNALIGGILVVLFLLFVRWNEFQQEQAELRAPVANAAPESLVDTPQDLPNTASPVDSDIPVAQGDPTAAQAVTPTPAARVDLVQVTTDTLNFAIDPRGGDIVSLSLLEHRVSLKEGAPAIQLLTREPRHTYISESDLVGPNGTHTRDGRVLFSAAQPTVSLGENDERVAVDLTHTSGDVTITKRFSIERGSYVIKIEYFVDNRSAEPWRAALYGRIRRDDYRPPAGGMFQLQPYLGAATATNEERFKKMDFEDIEEAATSFEKEGGWIAMVQHYFVSAWIPDPERTHNYSIKESADGRFYLVGFTGPLTTIAPQSQGSLSANFYAGPKTIENLEPLAPGLDLTIDFGVLWFIAKPLFLLLEFIHDLIGNWGVAIVLLTFIVKLVFFYPSAISYRSMAKMRKLMPMIQDLRDRYGDDRQRIGMETMKLYKKEGANPLGGCLPMLLQMPVFMALYWMIMESVELRHSPFVLWIQDLSVKDPFYVLPIIMGGMMYVQQKLNPPPQDPMQAKIFQFMPIGFAFIMMFLPAALTLYMAVNITLSLLQQYVITRQIEAEA